MDVSVILVNYNTKDMTRDCLNSIFNFTKDLDFEVFVVDNNSQDGSSEMIEQEFPQVRLIKNSENKGFGSANNIAIRQSEAKYVFCLNTDTFLVDNSIKKLFDFMENPENKNVGSCGCQLLDKNMQPQHSYGCYPRISRIIFTLFGLALLFPKTYRRIFTQTKNENDETPYEVEYITGADLFIRKSVLDEVGMYDEDFFMYFEDSELEYRINKAGYKNVIIPTVHIVHYCGLPPKNPPLPRLKMSRESEIKYYRKRSGKFAALFVKILYLLRYIFDVRFNKSYIEKILLHCKL